MKVHGSMFLKTIMKAYLRIADEAHILHWWGSSSFSVHLILQDFYEGLRENVDRLAEFITDNESLYIDDFFEIDEKLLSFKDISTPFDVVSKCSEINNLLGDRYSDSAFNTILDDIIILCKSTRYKLNIELGSGRLSASEGILSKVKRLLGKFNVSGKILRGKDDTYSIEIERCKDADKLNNLLNKELLNDDWFSYIESESDSKLVINIERMI